MVNPVGIMPPQLPQAPQTPAAPAVAAAPTPQPAIVAPQTGAVTAAAGAAAAQPQTGVVWGLQQGIENTVFKLAEFASGVFKSTNDAMAKLVSDANNNNGQINQAELLRVNTQTFLASTMIEQSKKLEDYRERAISAWTRG